MCLLRKCRGMSSFFPGAVEQYPVMFPFAFHFVLQFQFSFLSDFCAIRQLEVEFPVFVCLAFSVKGFFVFLYPIGDCSSNIVFGVFVWENILLWIVLL